MSQQQLSLSCGARLYCIGWERLAGSNNVWHFKYLHVKMLANVNKRLGNQRNLLSQFLRRRTHFDRWAEKGIFLFYIYNSQSFIWL